MKPHYPFMRGGVVLAAFMLMSVSPLSYAQEQPVSIARMGTSSVGSTYYVIANGLGELLHEHANINVTVEPIGGSYANIFTMVAGKIDYAVTNSGAAYDGYNGVLPFTRRAGIGLIAQGQTSLRFILVRRDSDIRTLRDLNGKILIGARPALPEMAALSSALISAAGLTDLRIVSTKDTKETLRHIISGTVDGIIIPGGLRLPAVVQLFRDGVVDGLYLDEATVAKMRTQLPAYMYTQIVPAGHFEGLTADMPVFGLGTYLVASDDAPEQQVYLITRTLFEHLKEFTSLHAEARAWTLANTLADPKIPFHPGAVRYFREMNLWTEDLERKQQELLGN
jgi:TRAP transporter TAXI family solute receptor